MQKTLPEVSDHQITQAMRDYGGGFVKQLGLLYRLADNSNQDKIKEAFPEYWQKYSELADQLRCQKCGSSNVLRRHHDGTAAVPECSFKECEDCYHQWDHN